LTQEINVWLNLSARPLFSGLYNPENNGLAYGGE